MPTTPLFPVSQEGIVLDLLAYTSSPTVYNCSSTKKVVGVSTISRLEHASAQTREVQCTRQVLPEVIERGKYVNMCNTLALYVQQPYNNIIH